MASGKKILEKCAKCGEGMTVKTEMRMVIDLTWYAEKYPKYKTWRAKLCVECLKVLAPIIKEFGFIQRKKNEDDI